jgi:peptidoglycan/xylan/chitin deacetylase (PgdA/CDA1 family)
MLTRRDFLKLAGVGAAAAALGDSRPVAALGSPSPPLIWRGSTRHRYVALTYDDCYLVNRMQGLEELLGKFPDFKITLFPVGTALLNNDGKDPGIWKRFYDKGHEIGYHSWEHTNFGVMSDETALEDYARWLEALTHVLGFTPAVRFGRPTYGSLAASFDTVCREYRLVNTMWSTGWGGELA